MEFDQAKSTLVELNTSSPYFITATEDGDEIFSVTRAGGVRINGDKGKLTIYCNTYSNNADAIAYENTKDTLYKTPS